MWGVETRAFVFQNQKKKYFVRAFEKVKKKRIKKQHSKIESATKCEIFLFQ